jgi:hypothetical protein
MIMTNDRSEELWQERFRAVGRAQAHYLWLLLVVGIFYFALDRKISREDKPSQLDVPVIGIEADSRAVWACGPMVLAFIALATLGTFPALTHARFKVDSDAADGDLFESLDTAPNAIDFAVYAPPDTWWRPFGLLAYPLFITLIIVESGWIWCHTFSSRASCTDCILLCLGGLFILFGLRGVLSVWKSKITKMLENLSGSRASDGR